MDDHGYSKTYVARFTRALKSILARANSAGWSGYTDVYRDYTKTSRSPDYLREKPWKMRKTDTYQRNGQKAAED